MVVPVGVSDVFPAPFIIYPLGILALLIPAPVHFKSGNTGVILFILYAASTQIILLVNSIVWRGNISNPAPFWCDLSTFILAITASGMAGATLCITRQLHKLSKAQAVMISQSEKRKELMIDLFTGVIVPLLVGGGHAIVQGHRYDVFEDVGCMPTTYNVHPAYPLFFIWPLVLSLISATFGLLALRQFLKRRKNFEMLLSSNSTGMQKNRYLRLMWLCCIDLVIAIPWHTYIIIDNLVNVPLFPWVSWAETQFDWYRIDFYRRIIIDMSPYLRLQLIGFLFIQPVIAIVFFLLFGLTRETVKGYANAWYFVMRPFGIKRPARTAMSASSHGPRKRSWLDRLLGRDAIPLNSTNGVSMTSSFPTFAQQHSGLQSKSIPSARPKVTSRTTATHSATDTLNWDDDLTEPPMSNHSNVMVIDGRRLTIPGLNGMSSFESDDMYDEKSQESAYDKHRDPHSRSPV
ncbi:hypothetical protein M408DRAFT_246575 [Serendipita vermifera MAFF 305830]|uniref:Uncharacterized protein n=1 Tax=Serendipita vermifera MAFF 305830 TaxID=933852 RepID=A0A0C2WBX2_SERVB|nr:hypothetical protein M408DRAFT_246575 [Serendipita vermifera MAFF 305830]